MAWGNNSNGSGVGSAFSKQPQYNPNAPSKPGPESPSGSHHEANYPTSSSRGGMGSVSKAAGEQGGKQGPIDVGGASHSGAFGMQRLRNRVMQMAAQNSRIGGKAGSNLGTINL